MDSRKGAESKLIRRPGISHRAGADLEPLEAALQQAEKLLQERDTQLRAYYQNTPLPTYTWQRQGDVLILTDYNRAALEFTGGAVVNSIGKKAHELYRDTPEVLEALNQCLTERVTLKRELQYRLASTDSSKCLSVSYIFIPPDSVIVQTEDLTERTRIETALEASEQRFWATFDQAAVGITHTDVNGRWQFVNQKHCEILGYTREELLTLQLEDISHPDDLERDRQYTAQLLAGEISSFSMEKRYIRKDEAQIWANLTVSLVRDVVGNPQYLVGIIEDITPRILAKAELQAMCAQVRELNANLEHQVQEHTAQIQQASQFEAVLKRITDAVRDSLDEAQILQTAVRELGLALNASRCDTGLYDLEQGTSTICYEYSPCAPSSIGRVVWMRDFPAVYPQLLQGQYLQLCEIVPNPVRPDQTFLILVCPMSDHHGVVGDLWLFRHPKQGFRELEIRLMQQVANQCAIAIRQARLYQAAQVQVVELKKVNQLKDDFLDTVSHELRTPIANMKMAIKMLQIASSDEQRQRYLQILQTECNREADLINELLDLQRLEAGAELLELEPLHLQQWLPPVVAPFQERATSREQCLQVRVAPDLPVLPTNPSSLERIVAELLNNACKYTPPGGTITVSVAPKPNTLGLRPYSAKVVELKVVNSSMDIPASELVHIFEKFYRIPSSDPWKQGGTGLGLALVKRLVEQIGGQIRAKSQANETSFTVELPCVS
ncbi:GAF domain-containing sensor histidine kinase [Leptolyngbya sp. FACHB-261]|uniref:sensor histidine kinase n=1 Tax=Leptolyngbya sp. FACHB-261 TaxID=2692806 RepID=UPI0016823DB1|nr:GAF domain-containing sensor histidine kinase [Leptolyngbya sp. FACHB-261]MBD2101448.1 PAS domain S-box protein [Leptolyngbya sp. FACHB-261]